MLEFNLKLNGNFDNKKGRKDIDRKDEDIAINYYFLFYQFSYFLMLIYFYRSNN